MNLKLTVDIGEVYQQERVWAGVSNDSLQDAIDDDDERLVVESFLQLPGLPPGLRQPRLGGGLEVEGLTVHEAFAAFCFLWLVLGATVLEGLKLVEKI